MNSAAELLICREMKPLANSKILKVHKPLKVIRIIVQIGPIKEYDTTHGAG